MQIFAARRTAEPLKQPRKCSYLISVSLTTTIPTQDFRSLCFNCNYLIPSGQYRKLGSGSLCSPRFSAASRSLCCRRLACWSSPQRFRTCFVPSPLNFPVCLHQADASSLRPAESPSHLVASAPRGHRGLPKTARCRPAAAWMSWQSHPRPLGAAQAASSYFQNQGLWSRRARQQICGTERRTSGRGVIDF